MAMNIDRHMTAHWDMFNHLVAKGDGDSAEKHRDFYDEYMAVMDLTAEFYLQTVDIVFVKHSLPKGEMMHRDQKPIDLGDIRRCALMTVEGENDDISGVGQTKATHALCKNLPARKSIFTISRRMSGTTACSTARASGSDIAPAIVANSRQPSRQCGRAAHQAQAQARSAEPAYPARQSSPVFAFSGLPASASPAAA